MKETIAHMCVVVTFSLFIGTIVVFIASLEPKHEQANYKIGSLVKLKHFDTKAVIRDVNHCAQMDDYGCAYSVRLKNGRTIDAYAREIKKVR